MNKGNNIITAICLFIGLILLGVVIMQAITIGTIEAGFIYLSAVIGTGLFWIGSKVEKS
jgi:hypothetical protein